MSTPEESQHPELPALETNPTPGQQLRLEGWLYELGRACRRHAIRLIEHDGELHMVDAISGTLIGVGLMTFEDPPGHTRDIVCDTSILDGVWLVKDEQGSDVEQRELHTGRWGK
jgi:hypothetical protein